MAQRIFKPIQLYVDTLTDQAIKDELTRIFGELETKRTVEVQQNRKASKIQLQAQTDAMKAIAEAAIAKTEADILQLSLLEEAAKHFLLVSQESQWVAYRDNKNGRIVLESIFTRRDQRNAMRVEKANLESAAGAGDLTNFFESAPDSDKDDKHIGFSGKGLPESTEVVEE